MIYNPGQVVPLFAAVGATARIQLGAGEEVRGVLVSDQAALSNEPDPDESDAQTVATGGGRQASPGAASCDRNLCRSVIGNFVYLRPLRELAPQPLFLQTQHCDAAGKCEQVPYALELVTRPGDLTEQTQNTYYGLAFTYPARDAAVRRRAAAERAAKWRERQDKLDEQRAMAPLPTPVSYAPVGAFGAAAENWQWVWQSEPHMRAALMPDDTWDDGRSTFLRYNGMRRIPNVYMRNPDGTKTLVAFSAEPGPTGTVLRIGRTAAMFVLEDGAYIGAIHNAGPDPEGRGSLTVAPAPAPAPVPLRIVARPRRHP